jgi:hypothetical protein
MTSSVTAAATQAEARRLKVEAQAANIAPIKGNKVTIGKLDVKSVMMLSELTVLY